MKEWSACPALLGGGIFCNSGCYGCSIEKMLKSVELLTEQGEVVQLSSKQLGFAFRTSSMKRGELKGIILRAYFDISKHEDKNVLKQMAESYKADRKETQDPPKQNLGTTLNTSGYKNNLRNKIISAFVIIYALVFHDKQKQYHLRKILTCLIYNRKNISKYISDKRMNCFIWKDDGADDVYPEYLTFMDEVFENCTLEIITKE
jgi:UDP-N-acetylenolpyruvoylglucosamine reductase